MDIKHLITQSRVTPVEKMYAKIDRAEVVTFDIFDTLILRDVTEPTDIFSVVESRTGLPFTDVRHLGEMSLRDAHPGEDITMDQIYSYLTVMSDDNKAILKQDEIETELRFCHVNPQMFPVYQYCVSHGKKIYAISDMYLPTEVIRKMLENAGYEISKIYVSAEHGVNKYTGQLYELFLKEEGIDPKKMLHIGDAFKADYLWPKKYGITSALYSRKQYDPGVFSSKAVRELKDREKEAKLADRIMFSLVRNYRACTEGEDIFAYLGYVLGGPIYLGFTSNEILISRKDIAGDIAAFEHRGVRMDHVKGVIETEDFLKKIFMTDAAYEAALEFADQYHRLTVGCKAEDCVIDLDTAVLFYYAAVRISPTKMMKGLL